MLVNRTSFKKTVPPSPSKAKLLVKLLMYAFGDDPNPSPDSVAVLEDIVTEYINEMVIPTRTSPFRSGLFPRVLMLMEVY